MYCSWENPFGFRSVQKHSLVKRVLHLKMKSFHQTVFLNALESERIFPTTVGNFTVRNPYSNIYCISVHLYVGCNGLSLQNSNEGLEDCSWPARGDARPVTRSWRHSEAAQTGENDAMF